MNKKILYPLVLSLITLFFFSSCQGKVKTPEPDGLTKIDTPQGMIAPLVTHPWAFETDDGLQIGSNSNCQDRSDFGDITEDIPANGAVVNWPFFLRWDYDFISAGDNYPDWENVCVPTSFTIYLSPGPDYSTSTSYTFTPTRADNLNTSLSFNSSPSSPLQANTSYRWIVVGHYQGIDIDQDQISLFQDESVWKKIGAIRQMRGIFQTGPLCDPSTIGPVDLITPQDQSVIDPDSTVFRWNMPNCSSMAYHLEINTSPQFPEENGTGWHITTEDFLVTPGLLDPCIIYYWRVKAGLYSTTYHQNNEDWSSISQPRTFIISDPSCPNASAAVTATPESADIPIQLPTNTPTHTPTPPPDMGSVKVHIWEDDFPFGLPQGKLEQNISGVEVYLKSGGCGIPSLKPRKTTTDGIGNAYFSNVSFGIYCVYTDIVHCASDGSYTVHPPGYPVGISVSSTSQLSVNIGFRKCIK